MGEALPPVQLDLFGGRVRDAHPRAVQDEEAVRLAEEESDEEGGESEPAEAESEEEGGESEPAEAESEEEGVVGVLAPPARPQCAFRASRGACKTCNVWPILSVLPSGPPGVSGRRNAVPPGVLVYPVYPAIQFI
eukprot:8931805-Alexandrium_andersonii.AAC.1